MADGTISTILSQHAVVTLFNFCGELLHGFYCGFICYIQRIKHRLKAGLAGTRLAGKVIDVKENISNRKDDQ